jgi:uncharacterized repeat protein (TIGR02543 family)
VLVIATANGGYVFSGWTGTDNNGVNPTNVTMSSDKTVTGNFASNCYHLTLSVGSGSGTVDKAPASAGGCPDGSYPPGYSVTLVATPNSGYTFSSWTGTDNNAVTPTKVTMSSDKTVTGNFVQVTCYHLTASANGSGTVQAGPPSAGGCPNGSYPPGYGVTVIATPSNGYTFTGWTGADNSNNPTTVTMNSDRTVVGNFSFNCVHLTTSVGSGVGYVQVGPTNAGGCPEGYYPPGYSVTVVGTPSGGYVFNGWKGADNNGANPGKVTMSSDKSVTAHFSGVPTSTPTYTPTFTNTPTSTYTPTNTFTPTFTFTPTNTLLPDVPTYTPTFTFTPTNTPTSTPTNTPLPPDVPTSTPTNTPLPPGVPTPTPTSTLAPGEPTATPTSTLAPGEPTGTPTAGGAVTPEPTATEQPSQPTPTATQARANGDVDCNGHTTSIDAVYVLQYGAGMFFDLACRENADVSGDAHIDAIDSALILQYTAGLLAGF